MRMNQIRIAARRQSRAQLGEVLLHRHHLLAGHVAAALGEGLVLEKHRRHAGPLGRLHGPHHVVDIAEAGVEIDEHRQLHRGTDARVLADQLLPLQQADVGQAQQAAGDVYREVEQAAGQQGEQEDQQNADHAAHDGGADRLAAVGAGAHRHHQRRDAQDEGDGRHHDGTQALVRLLLLQQARDAAAGVRTRGYVSGYRGSPLGGLDLQIAAASAELTAAGVHFQPGVNEDLAATAIWGTQQVNMFEGAKYDGVYAMWYGKGPGVDRSGDVIKHGNVDRKSVV